MRDKNGIQDIYPLEGVKQMVICPCVPPDSLILNKCLEIFAGM